MRGEEEQRKRSRQKDVLFLHKQYFKPSFMLILSITNSLISSKEAVKRKRHVSLYLEGRRRKCLAPTDHNVSERCVVMKNVCLHRSHGNETFDTTDLVNIEPFW